MSYVLAKQVRGEELWFTGEFVDSGPQMTGDYRKAKKFETARSAYAYAAMTPHFRYHRAAPAEYRPATDGFKTRWWVK